MIENKIHCLFCSDTPLSNHFLLNVDIDRFEYRNLKHLLGMLYKMMAVVAERPFLVKTLIMFL